MGDASPPDRGRPAPFLAPRGGPRSARLLRRAISNPEVLGFLPEDSCRALKPLAKAVPSADLSIAQGIRMSSTPLRSRTLDLSSAI